MLLETIILLFTFIILYILLTFKKIHWHFDKYGVKYLPGVPVFGNTVRSTFGRRHWNDDLAEVYRSFPGQRYVGLIENMTPVILVRDPELVKTIAVKDFDLFTDHREFFPPELDALLADSVLMMKGDRWRRMRATLSPAFTGAKLKPMVGFMTEIAENIVHYLKDNPTPMTDVEDLLRRYTSDVIASVGFGLKIDSVRDRDNEFFKLGSKFFKLTTIQSMAILFPKLAQILGYKLFPEKVANFFKTILRDTIEYRKQNNVERADMIQLMMENSTEWSFDEMAAQVLLFFVAGFESPASAMTLCIHELALNPGVQETLHQEVSQFKVTHGQLNYDNVKELKYMECVINEALRKWSEVPVLDRVCQKTYQLPPPVDGGRPYMVRPGDLVYNAANILHRDPEYYPDPERFDPERFSEDNKKNIRPLTYLPFGVGPRACIGYRLAMVQLKLFLFHLVQNFQVLRCCKTMDPIQLQPLFLNIRPKDGTWVTLVARESSSPSS